MTIRRVSFIYIKDRKLLVALNEGKKRWYTPGGRVEPDETDEAALCRELAEELGIIIAPVSLQLYKAFKGMADEKTEDKLEVISFLGHLDAVPLPHNEIVKLDYFTSSDKHHLSPVAQNLFTALYDDGLVD